MIEEINEYRKLSKIFKDNGFNLYLVGGSVRDYLLEKVFFDIDLATDATPEDMYKFIKGDFSFSKYGNVKIKLLNKTVDITTFRKEKSYLDRRHPNIIKFIKSMKADSFRRDFTINAMYMDEDLNIYDFHKGRLDILSQKIQFIGNASKRIKEDPLRILRAIRFSLDLGFNISRKVEKQMIKKSHLLSEINSEKILMELKKIKNKDFGAIYKIFKKFNIHNLLDVLE